MPSRVNKSKSGTDVFSRHTIMSCARSATISEVRLSYSICPSKGDQQYLPFKLGSNFAGYFPNVEAIVTSNRYLVPFHYKTLNIIGR